MKLDNFGLKEKDFLGKINRFAIIIDMKTINAIKIFLILSIIILPTLILAENNGERRDFVREKRQDIADIKEIRKQGIEDRNDMRKDRRDDVRDIREKTRLQLASSTPEDIKKLREDSKKEIEKIREDFKKTIKENKASSTDLIKEKRADIIKNIQEKRDLFKEELELKKEQRASTTEALKAKFKANLEKIKDQNKKLKLENVSNNLNEINKNITNKASENINKIETVLISIESRTDKIAVNGVDVSNIRSLITAAENAIAGSRTLITNQALKTYIIDISTEEKAKISAGQTRDLLRADTKKIDESVKIHMMLLKKLLKFLDQ